MKFLIGRNALRNLLSIAQGVVPKKSSKPILTHVLLETAPETGLTIAATDEELSFSGTVQAEVEEAGETTVSAKDLYDIVRGLPDAPVEIEHDDIKGQLKITSGRIKFRLHTLPRDDFPVQPPFNSETIYSYDIPTLLQLIKRTSFAVSLDDTRFYLGGVYLERLEEENLKAVATDGHRLALAEADPPENFILHPGKILPRKMLEELKKMLEKREGLVNFSFEKRRVMFQIGSYTLISLLVEGSFPNYRQVIPKTALITCRVGRMELINALKRVSLLSPDKLGGVRFTVTPSVLSLSSHQLGRGEANQEVDILEGGGEVELGFNANYFIEALQTIDSSDVLLEFTNSLSPCLLRPYIDPDAKKEEKPHFHVIMPMRL